MLTSNVAQGAAGFAVAIRSRNKTTKQLAASAGLTGVLGITEPVLYGVNLKFIYPLIAAMVGGGVGGLVGVLLSVPVASVLYALLRRDVHKRLACKE